jgi:hypothetical protein
MATNAANHDTGRNGKALRAVIRDQADPQVAHKGAPEPLLWEEYLSAPCPGPAGTWPCALPFGHDGDHARFVESEPVPGRDHAAENAELRTLLRTSARLLADWPFVRGASFRRDLIARIAKAVR